MARPARRGRRPKGTQFAAASTTLNGFSDTNVWTGMTLPTSLRFAPDGRVFVAEKSGIIKVFDSISDTTPTVFADLKTDVDDYWDRGLLGMTLDPNFPASPYVYALYARDAIPGGSSPRWNDVCLTQPGPNTDGCLVSGRLVRLTMGSGGVSTSQKILIDGWCQQFPSHSIGDLRFGADGALYVTGGDGASFNAADYGQYGGTTGVTDVPKNPCGDPPGGQGATLTPPTARGGALRAQSIRRPTGDPVLLNGSLLRVDPATGDALSNNPRFSSTDANARRIVAHGFRNPFRFTIRPGTSEPWIGDVGWTDWEEIDRIVDPLAATIANAGWPCYEGNGQQGGYKALNLDLCASLYTTPTGLLTPYYTYSHGSQVVPGEVCQSGSSSISGITFYQGGNYPASYTNGLFFADHSRNCIWFMRAGSNGLPDKNQISTFISTASNPVDLETGPNGDLFYVDFEGGNIHRVTYASGNQAPTAVIGASPASGPSPLLVNLDGTGSTDPEGSALTYAWDLDDDGQYDDSTASKPTVTFTTAGTHTVRLRVTDAGLATGTASRPILVDDALPTPVIDTPAAGLTWKVGDLISFTGHATDGQGNALPASGLSWALVIQHCPSNCHTHSIQTWTGVAGGSFAAPDHDYPSYLELTLTATDASSRQASTTLRLDPRTVNLTFQSNPSGLSLVVGTQSEAGHAVHADGHRRVQPGRDRGQSADAERHDVRLRLLVRRRRGDAHDRRPRDRHDLHRQLRPRTARHHELPERSRLHGHGQRLGPGREGQEQRRAGRRRRQAADPQRDGLYQGPRRPRRLGRPLHDGQLHRVHRLGRGRRRGRHQPRLDRLPGLPRRRRRLRLGDDDRGDRDQGGQRQRDRQDRPAPAHRDRPRRGRLRPRRLGRRQADLRERHDGHHAAHRHLVDPGERRDEPADRHHADRRVLRGDRPGDPDHHDLQRHRPDDLDGGPGRRGL